jgi:exopolysaccharide biosynthesis polyprenyl glycosylphosphotransferase
LARTREERRFILFCFVTDVLLFWMALNLASLTRLHTLVYLDLWRLQVDRLVCAGLFALGAALAGAYDLARVGDPFDAVYCTWVGLAFAGLMEMALVSLLPTHLRAVSRRELVLGLMGAAVFLGAWRFYGARLMARLASLRRFFYVLGSESEAQRIAQAIRQSEGSGVNAQYVTIETFRQMVEGAGPRSVPAPPGTAEAVIALTPKDHDALIDLVSFCEEHCRRIFLYPSLHDTRLFRHGSVHAIGGIPVIELAGTVHPTPYLRVKRAMDIGVALTGLLVSLPVCLATAIAIKLTSPGGVFYAQERMGKDGRPFRLVKFRSMVADAEAATGPVWAAANDARVTAVGRFLRKHRIDEIPQLLNVLKGDMSLIGPRPERPHFHTEFRRTWPLFDKRLAVRPGLTSLSHVLGSYGSNPEDRLRYDLIYIGNLSLLTDLRILVATVRIILGAKGAQ